MIIYNCILLFLFFIFDIYLFYAFCSTRGGKYPPFVPAPVHTKTIIFKSLGKLLSQSPRSLHIIDPGCGIGTLLLPLAKKYPQHHFSGIEWNKMLYKICLFRKKKLANINFFYQNMLTFDYSTADIIICFLIPQLIPDLQKQIISTARPGTIIWSIDCRFSDLKETGCFDSRLFWTHFKIHCYTL